MADLWVRAEPAPMYVGDEYAAPLVGNEGLDRHWGRVAGGLSGVRVFDASTVRRARSSVVRGVLLSRWRLTARESDVERTGASWVHVAAGSKRTSRSGSSTRWSQQVYLAD